MEHQIEFTLHHHVSSLVSKGKLKEARSILSEVRIEDSSVLTWIDRALIHILLGEIEQANYALYVAEKLNAQKIQNIAPYYAYSKAMYYIQSEMDKDAIMILEAVEKPIIKPRNYEMWLYKGYGFPSYLLPSLSTLEKSNYDLENYILLERLYLKENRIEDAEWAKAQSSNLSAILNE